jgi:hypothetical protein
VAGDQGVGPLGRAAATESLRQVRAGGQLSRMYRLILDAIATHGPMTGTECYRAIETDQGVRLNYNTRTRFGELRAMGLLREEGLRLCTITHRRVIVWALGDGTAAEDDEPAAKCEACGRPLPARRGRSS